MSVYHNNSSEPDSDPRARVAFQIREAHLHPLAGGAGASPDVPPPPGQHPPQPERRRPAAARSQDGRLLRRRHQHHRPGRPHAARQEGPVGHALQEGERWSQGWGRG